MLNAASENAEPSGPQPAAAAAVSEGARVERVSGLGRVLVAVYIVLAVAATARSLYQIVSKFDEAPLAYSLSAAAGVVYIVATIALVQNARRRSSVGRAGGWRVAAWITLGFELLGVLVVGALSYIEPQLFGHPSVWSHFGSGYGYIPLVLPVLGLIWLSRSRAAARISEGTV